MKLRKVNGGDKRSVSVCETCCKFPRIHICGIDSLYVPATNLVFQLRYRNWFRGNLDELFVLHPNEKINCK